MEQTFLLISKCKIPSVNSHLCRHCRALWFSAHVMQNNQTLSRAVHGTAVCCTCTSLISLWLGAGGPKTLLPLDSWMWIPRADLWLEWSCKTVTEQKGPLSFTLAGRCFCSRAKSWGKWTPAPFEVHSDSEKRPWFSLNVRVLESVWIPNPEAADLKCRLGIWAVDHGGIFHSAKSPLWGITSGHMPAHMHIPVTQTWAQHRHKSPASIASFSRGCVVKKLGTTIKKTKWELEMVPVNRVTTESQILHLISLKG